MKNLALAPFGPDPQMAAFFPAASFPRVIFPLPVLTWMVCVFLVLFVMVKELFLAVHVPVTGLTVSLVGCHAGGDPEMLSFGPAAATCTAASDACMPAEADAAEAGATNPAMVMTPRAPTAAARASWFLIETNSVSFVVRLPVRPGQDGQRATAMRAHPRRP